MRLSALSYQASTPTDSDSESDDIDPLQESPRHSANVLSSREDHERMLDLFTRDWLLLGGSYTRRKRCEEGYLFNCLKNKEIVADDPWLQEMWLWIGGRHHI
jgi:hypothetical protein